MVDRGIRLFCSIWRSMALLLGINLLLLQAANAQGKAFASLMPERIETGDTFSLVVVVSGVNSKPKMVDFVSWTDVFPAANILRRSEWRRSGSQWVQQFSLIAFDSDTLVLPALAVLMAAGKPLSTNALSLTVVPSPGGELSDMAPMRNIYREPVSWMDYWPWAAGAIGVLAILYWYWSKKARRPKPVAPVAAIIPLPPVPASESALKKLQDLQQRKLWLEGRIKEHYAELSLIVREYLEGNYRIAALESTTREIMTLLASVHFPTNQTKLLRQILDQTDMVKYAQSTPPDGAHEAAIEKARELITPHFRPKIEPKKPVTVTKSPQKPHSGENTPPL